MVNEALSLIRDYQDDSEKLKECLNMLLVKEFEPSVLVKMNLGHAIKKLTSHDNSEVASIAQVTFAAQ